MKIKTLLLFVLITSSAFAAPVINSVGVNGTQISISGAFFGSNSKPVPLSFLNGDGKTNNAPLNDPAYIYEEPEPARYYYSTSQQHSGTSCITSLIKDWPDGAYMYYDYGAAGSNEVYMSFWVKMEVSGTYTTDGTVQIKWFSVRSVPTAGQLPYAGYGYYPRYTVDGANTFAWDNFASNVGYDGQYGAYGLPYPCITPCNPVENWDTTYVDPIPVYNQYFRVEWYGKRASAPNVADGTWITSMLQPGAARFTTHNRVGNATTHASVDEVWRYAGFRNELTSDYSTPINEELQMWVDDFVIDDTRARIEIGDNVNFNSCTHLEYQPALTWSQTAITGTLNIGSFAPNATVYFFVVDSDGIPSAGKLVNLSGTPTYDSPIITILTESQTTTSGTITIIGTLTTDSALTGTGVDVNGVTATSSNGFETWTATGVQLSFGSNTITATGTDSEAQTDTDTVSITRLKTSKTNGAATLKRTVLHQ